MSASPADSSSQNRTPDLPKSARGWLAAGITLVIVLILLVPIGAAMQIVLTAQFDDRTHTQAIVLMEIKTLQVIDMAHKAPIDHFPGFNRAAKGETEQES